MSVVQVDDNVYRLEESVTIKATHAAPVVLQENTVWTKIGTIEHGNVFDTKDQVVIVNSFDVHEAAVVIRDGYVVGFYLKAKQTYVSANPVAISLSEGESAHANP